MPKAATASSLVTAGASAHAPIPDLRSEEELPASAAPRAALLAAPVALCCLFVLSLGAWPILSGARHTSIASLA